MKLPLVFILLTVMIDAMGVGLILPVMPDLIREVQGGDLSDAALWGGVLATSFAAMQFLFGPVLGGLSDRYAGGKRIGISLVFLAGMAGGCVLLYIAGGIGVAAFAVALLGIYILVVAQFGSFRLPLVILTPIPLTFLGIIGGHWLFHAPFSATSMIGFIALAGIIVRNSILLVDFIRHEDPADKPMTEIILEAGAIRFKPILLTAIAAMIGAFVILSDPIFQGLAISLLFGLLSSTLLTVIVIPAIYRVFKT